MNQTKTTKILSSNSKVEQTVNQKDCNLGNNQEQKQDTPKKLLSAFKPSYSCFNLQVGALPVQTESPIMYRIFTSSTRSFLRHEILLQ